MNATGVLPDIFSRWLLTIELAVGGDRRSVACKLREKQRAGSGLGLRGRYPTVQPSYPLTGSALVCCSARVVSAFCKRLSYAHVGSQVDLSILFNLATQQRQAALERDSRLGAVSRCACSPTATRSPCRK